MNLLALTLAFIAVGIAFTVICCVIIPGRDLGDD